MLHLRPRARQMLHGGTLVARDADSSTVARLLLDRGLADPWWPTPTPDDEVTDVTVVVPVRDRPRQLARLLSALPRVAAGAGRRRRLRGPGPDPCRRRGVRRPAAAAPGQPRPRRRPQHRPRPGAHRPRRLPGLRRRAGARLARPAAPAPRRPRGRRRRPPRARRRPAARRRLAVPLRGGPLLAGPRSPARAGAAPGPGRLPPERGPAGPPVRPAPRRHGAGRVRRHDAGGRGRRPGLARARGRVAGALRAGGRRTPRPPDHARSLAAPQGVLRHRGGAARRAARHRRGAARAEPVDDRADRGGAGAAPLVAAAGGHGLRGRDRRGGAQAALRPTTRCAPPRR